MDISKDLEKRDVVNFTEITLGSLVKVKYDVPVYGIIRWIGYFPGLPDMRAGLELVYSLF